MASGVSVPLTNGTVMWC